MPKPEISRMRIIRQHLSKIYNTPCWGVTQGYGSMLFFEFGEPHLRIREPLEVSHSSAPWIRRLFSLRSARIRGDWRLTIYGCTWAIYSDGKEIATDTSTRRKIAKALAIVNGQALVDVAEGPRRGRWLFKFDLGASIETKRFDRRTEIWLLFEPSGFTLAVRGDAQYRYTPPGVAIRDSKWKPFETVATSKPSAASRRRLKGGNRKRRLQT
jgi:hypothetical protein